MSRRSFGSVILATAACAIAACASAPPPPKSAPANEPLAPSDLLPNDLDFVLRIDAARLAKMPVFAEAARELARSRGSPMLRAVQPIVAEARALYFGGRSMSDGFRGDGVVAIETDAAPGDAPRAGFTPLAPAFGGRAGIVLSSRAGAPRDEAALEVLLPGRGIVLATAAEIDAVLRVARDGPDADRLSPAARGLASFAAHFRGPSPAFVPGIWRRASEGLRRVAGTIDVDDAFRVEIDLFYESPRDAEGAIAVLRGLADALAGRLGRAGGEPRFTPDSIRLEARGASVAVRATVPFAIAAELH